MKKSLILFVPLLLLLGLLIRAEVSGVQPQAQPKNAGGWIDLFPGENLGGWKRVFLPPDKKLSARNPWRVDAKNRILQCDGKDIKEMLLYKKPFKNGTFHLEWRFRKEAGKKFGYNSGVYVRSANDGKVWLQVQTAMLDKGPLVGDIFGDLLINGKIERVHNKGTGTKHVNPPGQWNTYDIICAGKTITAKLNGATVSTYKNCPRTEGYVGVQAEYYFIEFKNLKWKNSR